jgi:hypothetical protein
MVSGIRILTFTENSDLICRPETSRNSPFPCHLRRVRMQQPKTFTRFQRIWIASLKLHSMRIPENYCTRTA